MMRISLSGILVFLLPLHLWSQTPDWSTKIAPILFNHCTTCHHSGGLAPISLTSYALAAANASAIQHDVLLKKMPPWLPDPSYAHMAHERILSDTEINILTAWINGGVPQGDPALAPPTPTYNHNGSIPGMPDLVVRIPNYASTADTADVYQCFVIPSGLLADKFIQSFEAIPGNSACVHHVLVFTDTSGMYAAMDAAYPGPGFPYFGGVAPDSGNALGVWVPGSVPLTCPPGFGLRMAHHSDIVVQIHYPAGTAGMIDSTEVHFFFSPDTGIREVFMQGLLNYEYNLIDAPLFVPANTVKKYEEEVMVSDNDLSLLGIFPHMHLLGKSIKSYGILPSGDTDRYISIPDWEFHWQNFYMFPKIKKAPVNTLLRAEAMYDNTTNNEDNPNSPPKDVGEGEKSTDEMMLVVFLVTKYQTGDENIVINNDPTVVADQHYYHGQQLLDVIPNPAVDNIVVKCFSEKKDYKTISLIDMQGKTVRNFMNCEPLPEGYSYNTFSVHDILPGNYILVLKTCGQIFSKKIMIVAN